MDCSVLDRLIMLQFIPKEGDLVTLMLGRDMQRRIEFTPEEIQAYGIKSTADGAIVWDTPKEKMKSISFNARELTLLDEQITIADRNKTIPMAGLDTVQRIKEMARAEVHVETPAPSAPPRKAAKKGQ